MYLLLKTTNTCLKSHPITRRLYQYRLLLSQMEPIYLNIKPQIESLLQEKALEKVEPKKENKKTLKVLRKLSNQKSNTDIKVGKDLSKKNKDLDKIVEEGVEAVVKDDTEDENMEQNDNELEQTDSTEKRRITYQMAKNKGLTPHRKKEQRNPRVKHRNKFRKAKIRRKGAVREIRRELARYGGEISGIKASVSKSIKIKS